MDPLLDPSVNSQYDEEIHGFPLPLVASPPYGRLRKKAKKLYQTRACIGTAVILGFMGLGAALWAIFMAPLLHTADQTMAQAGPVMNEATKVMAKSEVLFKLLWQAACNGTVHLLPPDDCSVLHP